MRGRWFQLDVLGSQEAMGGVGYFCVTGGISETSRLR